MDITNFIGCKLYFVCFVIINAKEDECLRRTSPASINQSHVSYLISITN